jgi:hypothetical protein
MEITIIEKFEYFTKIIRVSNQQTFNDILNSYGDEGWELVMMEKTETNVYQAVFKRKIIITF